MSVPPDQFDDGEPPDDEEISEDDFSDEFIAWRADSDPPEWFENAANLLGELEDRDSVMLDVNGGITPESLGLDEFGEYHLVMHGFDEDTGEDLYWEFDGWTYDQLMDFYDYIEDYYADVAFWSENYSLANI